MGTYSANYNLFLTAEQDEVDVLLNITDNFAILDTALFDVASDVATMNGDYVTLTSAQTITGLKSFKTSRSRSILSAEMVTTQNFSTSWTTTGWTATTTTATHTVGNTSALTAGAGVVPGIVAGSYYVVGFTITGATAGTVTPTLGGTTGTAIAGNSVQSQILLATNTNVPTFVPSTDFDGVISAYSVKSITGSIPNMVALTDTDNPMIEIRGGGGGNSVGQESMFFGREAGEYVIEDSGGASNLGVGLGALRYVMNAVNNTAVGTLALEKASKGTNNTAIGRRAMQNAVAGAGNTAIGREALQNSSNAQMNVAIGYAAAQKNINGSFNVFLGAQAGNGSATPTNLSKSVALGYNAQVATSNSMVLGGTGVDAVSVGIGTTTPLARLHVETGAAASMGALIKAATSQTASLLEFQNSASQVTSLFTLSTFLHSGTASIGSTNSVPANIRSIIYTGAATTVGVVVRAAASQSADLQQWQDSAAGLLAKVDSGGNWYTFNRAFYGTLTYAGAYTLYAQSGAADQVAVAVRGRTSQTANLQEWQNNAGTVLSYIDDGGRIRAQSGITNSANVTNSFGGPVNAATILTVHTNAAGNIGLLVKGAASQSGDLTQWQNSSGTVIASVSSAGTLTVGTPSGSRTAVLGMNDLTFKEWTGATLFNFTLNDAGTGPRIAGGPLQLTGVPIQTFNAGTVALVVKAAASQSANIQEWHNSAGGLLAYVHSGGAFVGMLSTDGNYDKGFKAGANTNISRMTAYTHNEFYVWDGAAYSEVVRMVGGAAGVKLSIKGSASQTANLTEWQNSAGTVLTKIVSTGEFESMVTGAGIVLKSPDGTRWRITVDNNGSLVTGAA